ncbi:MAG TPA: aminotransferase class V-fold PLP-dependent enzyme [Thermoanaerobaculia bacterium]|nr:aminotransferase class V-fold PLP-dependent enzyme [Thermoanaerobaculia bacterium]
MDLTDDVLDREFPSRRHSVQFNHAAVCPLPARAAAALAAFAENVSTRGSLDWKTWNAETERLRAAAARLVGAGESVGGARSVSVVPNTTWGLNLVAEGLDLGPGDSVVTTASEFPANLTPWVALERKGVAVRRLPTRDGAFAADELFAACDATTKVVCVSAVAFHTGFRAPMEEIGAFCRGRGIVFGLDAIQAVGAVPVDVAGWNVDFLSADGHKWMLGPEGCGILFTRPSFRERVRPPAGWTNLKRVIGANFRVPERPEYVSDAGRFEVGALPMPGVRALRASLELLLEIGLETVGRRIAATLAVLIEGLPKLGFEPVLFGGPPRSGILAARPPAGKDARLFAKKLEERSIVVTAREGFLRFSPHVGNDEAEAERVLAALRGPA